jgi:hypothetical protein
MPAGRVELVGSEAGDQIVDSDPGGALPPGSVRLALLAYVSGQQLAQRDPADRGAGQVAVEPVVEGQPLPVA